MVISFPAITLLSKRQLTKIQAIMTNKDDTFCDSCKISSSCRINLPGKLTGYWINTAAGQICFHAEGDPFFKGVNA